MSRAGLLLEHARVRAGGAAADTVAVRGGRIVGIGRRRAMAALLPAGAKCIDCGGATLLPGLVDPHLHLYALASRHAELDCSRFTTAAALLAAVRIRATRVPAGAWVRGAALDEAALDRLPTAAELDRVSPHAPVRLRHRSRHASLLSEEALRRLPGMPSHEALVGGREDAIGRAVGPLPADVLAAGLESVGRELAAHGLTTVADATPRGAREHAPLRALMRTGAFRLRVVGMRRRGDVRWRDDGRLRPGPVKIQVDEGPGGMRPDPLALARRIAAAAGAGAQVAVHCVGAATLVASLAAFAALPVAWRRGRRHRLEHVAECPPPLVSEIARLGLGVVTNPGFVYWRGDVYRRETEPRAQGWLYRARTLAAAGIPLAGASDAPVVDPSPWIAIAAARTRRTRTGALLGGAERLGARAALALYTTAAAYALRADELGRLVVGGPADLVAVEPDPLYAPPDEVRDTRVVLTIAGGEVAWPG